MWEISDMEPPGLGISSGLGVQRGRKRARGFPNEKPLQVELGYKGLSWIFFLKIIFFFKEQF